MKNQKKTSIIFLLLIIVLIVVFGMGGFYVHWNSSSPERTCLSCHEIEDAFTRWTHSPHRDLHCKECHGTALSNGFHSLKEKGRMVVRHYTREQFDEIKMKEEQILDVMNNCNRCHQSEYAGWMAGGHSANYKAIFLNEEQNKKEQLNWDCLRCHGMFYEHTIKELVTPLDREGPWHLKEPDKASEPTIPCMACHQIHKKGAVFEDPDFSSPEKIFYNRADNKASVSFFDRTEKMYIPAEDLPHLKLWEGERSVQVSNDPRQSVCVQCHAPGGFHQAGTSDDNTPMGVHEGMSCMACHEPHNNDSRQSCKNCHPAMSNCGLDVTTMNTTFRNPESEHDIHTVSCVDCHSSDEFIFNEL